MKTSEILSIVALISLGLGAITFVTSKILHKKPGNTPGVKLFIFLAICCVAISGLLGVTSEKMTAIGDGDGPILGVGDCDCPCPNGTTLIFDGECN